jgi:hypothetical protein
LLLLSTGRPVLIRRRTKITVRIKGGNENTVRRIPKPGTATISAMQAAIKVVMSIILDMLKVDRLAAVECTGG